MANTEFVLILFTIQCTHKYRYKKNLCSAAIRRSGIFRQPPIGIRRQNLTMADGAEADRGCPQELLKAQPGSTMVLNKSDTKLKC
jgi:hypothetical protein